MFFCFRLHFDFVKIFSAKKRSLVLFFKRWQTLSSVFVGLHVDSFFFFGNCARAHIRGRRAAKARVRRAGSVSGTSPGKFVVF